MRTNSRRKRSVFAGSGNPLGAEMGISNCEIQQRTQPTTQQRTQTAYSNRSIHLRNQPAVPTCGPKPSTMGAHIIVGRKQDLLVHKKAKMRSTRYAGVVQYDGPTGPTGPMCWSKGCGWGAMGTNGQCTSKESLILGRNDAEIPKRNPKKNGTPRQDQYLLIGPT